MLFLIDSHSSLSCPEKYRMTAITILIFSFQLESLVLDNNMLTTVVLEVNISHNILLLLCLVILIPPPPLTDHQQSLSRRLRFLSLLGNRLRCDCKVSNLRHHNELNRHRGWLLSLSWSKLGGVVGFGTSQHPLFMKNAVFLPLSCHEWQGMGPKEVFYSYLVPGMIW